jgi:hypothetical protein
MRSLILASVILLLPLTCVYAASEPSDLIPPLQSETPVKLGFHQFNKCHGEAKGLGDTKTAATCLAACTKQPEAKGCWWLDGSGGFDRECRICLDGSPSRDIFPNDWGIAVNH